MADREVRLRAEHLRLTQTERGLVQAGREHGQQPHDGHPGKARAPAEPAVDATPDRFVGRRCAARPGHERLEHSSWPGYTVERQPHNNPGFDTSLRWYRLQQEQRRSGGEQLESWAR